MTRKLSVNPITARRNSLRPQYLVFAPRKKYCIVGVFVNHSHYESIQRTLLIFMSWSRFPTFSEAVLSSTNVFKKKARLLVDESLGTGVNDLLRKSGWNTLDGREAGLVGHPDENWFAYALRDDRILLTHDEDFLNDRKFPFDSNRNPGVIVLPGACGGDSVLLRGLRMALHFICDSRELYRGAKVWISL